MQIASALGLGRTVFVDFTAAWCLTCQVNERIALSGKEVHEVFARNNVAYLKADWTNRNPIIAKTLAENGRVGVPLYLVYGPAAAKPVILPQLLTAGMVIEAIEDTAPRH
jgi:thiol:disulfide interchange protein